MSANASETIRLAPLAAYQLWAETWETEPSAIIALESRWTLPWLSDVRGMTVFDLSRGVGRWLAHAQAQGAAAFGTDLSREMLLRASNKPGLSGRLALAETGNLPLPTNRAELAL